MAYLLGYLAEKERFAVERIGDGRKALERIDRGDAADLVLLDVMLPYTDGFELLERLRSHEAWKKTPVIILTSRTREHDAVRALSLGADDYLTKPFSIRELVARVKAIFRRLENLQADGTQATEGTISLGEIEIDVAKREVRRARSVVNLTTKEFELLLHFVRNPGRVYTRLQLLDMVWGYGYDGYEHNVNCHINRLRGKIETDPARPQVILTVRGVGYKLGDPQPAGAEA